MRLNLGGMNDRLRASSGHGYPHLVPKEKTETKENAKKKDREHFHPKKTPFACSSAARKKASLITQWQRQK